MEQEIDGYVVSVKKQWWLKINTKSFRKGPLDGAIFPHIIKVRYIVRDKEYTKKKWINAGKHTPCVGDTIKIVYDESKPSKAKILL